MTVSAHDCGKVKLKAVSAIMLTLLLIGMLTLAFNIQPVKAEPKTIYVDDDNVGGPWDGTPQHPYQNITSALEHASVNDTIYVYTGTYYENVVVNKTVSLIGENKYNTIIDSSQFGAVVVIVDANNVNFSGFTIRHSVTAYSNSDPHVPQIPPPILFGIQIWSSGNNISHNIITSNVIGIDLWKYSSNNSITGNNIANHTGPGIRQYRSSRNTVSGNNITNNQYGIYLYESSNNRVYHNNFIDNTQQVYFYESGYANVWDDGYPSGGNYWSDYTGVDLYSGPSQNESGSDGIGDTLYIIDENNVDRYPLMKPVTDLVGRSIRIVDAKTGLDSITLGSPTEPMPSGGYPFTVNVTLDGATDYLHSFKVVVAFDKTKVKCTAAWIPRNDPNFVFYGESGLMGSVGVYNDEGLVVLGSSLPFDYVIPDHALPHYVNVSGVRLLCQINFTAIEAGTSVLEIITDPVYFPTWKTILSDINNNAIDFTRKVFSVTTVAFQQPPVTAYVSIQPHVLNLRSRGKWVTTYIELPDGYNLSDVNRATVMLNDIVPVDPFWVDKPLESVVGDYDDDGIPDLMVKFNRKAVIEYLLGQNITYGKVTLTVIGELYDGTSFEGSDIIRVKMPSDVNSSCDECVDNYKLVVPEFPSFLILPLFIIATLLAVIIYRRKHSM